MLPRADIVGTRPVASVEATRPAVATGDTHQELSQRLNRIALGSFLEGQILSRLQDGSFVVKVADTALRMNLPSGSQVGETLDLTLVATQPRPAFLLSTQARNNAASLSSAGRLVDWIIHTAKAAGGTATLLGAAPLNSAADASAEKMAASLKDAVEFSGLFYESHLEQWAAGKRPLAALVREPQAKNSDPELLSSALKSATQSASPPADLHLGDILAHLAGQPDAARSLMTLLRAARSAEAGLPPSGGDDAAQAAPALPQADGAEASGAQRQGHMMAAGLPAASPLLHAGQTPAAAASVQLPVEKEAEILQKTMSSDSVNMVNLQLNALEQHRIAWQGELWPGQQIEWEISDETPQGQQAESQEKTWQSVIRFELPALGKVSAAVRLTGERLQIQVRTADEQTASLLRAHGNALSSALAAAGAQLEMLSVQRSDEV